VDSDNNVDARGLDTLLSSSSRLTLKSSARGRLQSFLPTSPSITALVSLSDRREPPLLQSGPHVPPPPHTCDTQHTTGSGAPAHSGAAAAQLVRSLQAVLDVHCAQAHPSTASAVGAQCDESYPAPVQGGTVPVDKDDFADKQPSMDSDAEEDPDALTALFPLNYPR
jgi:hypothetical protein